MVNSFAHKFSSILMEDLSSGSSVDLITVISIITDGPINYYIDIIESVSMDMGIYSYSIFIENNEILYEYERY